MTSKNYKNVCSLKKYLETKDKDLYQAFDDLCVFSLFRASGDRGVTLLYPTDKAYRKKIIHLAYSNTPEKAIDMIKSLVLMDYLPSPIDFKNKKDDIPNALRKKLEVEEADFKTVTLKGGLKLELDSNFVAATHAERSVVYKLIGTGELSTTGCVSDMKYARNTNMGVSQGAMLSEKNKLSAFVEDMYINDSSGKNIYKYILSGLYKYVLDINDVELNKRVYSGICATARATYYNLLCPHSNTDTYKLPHGIWSYLSSAKSDWKKSKAFAKNNWSINRNRLIKCVRGEFKQSERDEIYKKQINALKNSKTANDYRDTVIKHYNKDNNRICKDLLTIYCYLSAINESHDSRYYKDCFIYTMRNIFNNASLILGGTNDLAHILTMYGNLLKSDAFLYYPVLMDTDDADPQHTDKYENLEGHLPEPTDGHKLFTIIYNTTGQKHGGRNKPDDKRTLFGGVQTDVPHDTQTQKPNE